MSELDPDRILMLKVKSGDRGAFSKLYGKFKGPILSYVYHSLSNRQKAEEITQEVFLKVYGSRERYEPEAKFSTWLWTIARNTLLDQLRRKQETLAEDPVQSIELIESETPSAEEQLIDQVKTAQLEHCFSELSEWSREVVSLRIFSELSYEEIAASVEATLSSIKSTIHRAKADLIECLRRCGGLQHE